MSMVFLYIEGGGDSKTTKKPLRKGFRLFLRNMGLDDSKIQIVLCGGRNATYKRFDNACRNHTAVYNVLLVDSEGPVNTTTTPKQYLRDRDSWQVDGSDDQYHLMVQAMEAWLIADQEAVKLYYGQGFQESALPDTQDVEQIEKDILDTSLNRAANKTNKKEYHKIRDGAKLLDLIDANTVREKARHCNRLFQTLTNKIEEN